ncbi:MAG: class I SAM-dependent methyltransferase [Myxococcota bacterium]
MELDSGSLERLVPDELEPGHVTGSETLRLHLERYEFAARHARPGRLLDMACGVGYGTRLLVDRVRPPVSAMGVDISEEAIAYARKRYGGCDVEFRGANALQFHDPDGFDTIVSIETVEHVEDAEGLIARLVGLLRPGGVLVVSVPTTPSVDLNPHHHRDFSESSLRRLVGRHPLREIDCLRQVQSVRLGRLLTRREVRTQDLRRELFQYYLRHPDALGRRLWSTMRYGFSNRYLTIAFELPGASG